MHIPVFLVSIFVVILLVSLVARRNDKSYNEKEREYQDKIRRSNMTTKKDISNLDFITIPPCLSSTSGLDSEEIKETEKQIAELSDKKIVNFTGISNTDLKLTYGTANIDFLSEYDNNYLKLVRLVVKYSSLLIEAGMKDKAREILEFGVSVKSDVSSNYTMLASLYKEAGRTDDLENLRRSAEALSSLTKNKLLKDLDSITNGQES